MTDLTAEQITSLYLYGQSTPPSNLVDDGLIRVPETDPIFQPVTVAVDVVQFMTTGAGRFALATMSSLVRHFFSPDANDPFIPPGQYTKVQLAGLFGLSEYGIDFQQYNYDDGNNDYAERTFIWNSSSFAE
jgi:hypothetical protein